MPFRVFIAFGGPQRAMEHSLPVAARNPTRSADDTRSGKPATRSPALPPEGIFVNTVEFALSKTRLAGSPATRSWALPADVKFRAERKLGGRAEALTPQRLRSVFIAFGGPPRAMVTPSRSRLGIRFRPIPGAETGDKIAGATGLSGRGPGKSAIAAAGLYPDRM
jgi:hypothetical protein